MDQYTDYPYRPHPKYRIEIISRDFTYCLSNRSLMSVKFQVMHRAKCNVADLGSRSYPLLCMRERGKPQNLSFSPSAILFSPFSWPFVNSSPSSETQGPLVGAGKSLNGQEKNSGKEKSFSTFLTNCPWVSEDDSSQT